MNYSFTNALDPKVYIVGIYLGAWGSYGCLQPPCHESQVDKSPARRKIQVQSRNHGKRLGRERGIRKDYEALTGLGQFLEPFTRSQVGITGW